MVRETFSEDALIKSDKESEYHWKNAKKVTAHSAHGVQSQWVDCIISPKHP